MTSQLRKVFSKLEKLPEAEQNALASILSEELEWDVAFKNSGEKLQSLAAEALAEYKTGKTKCSEVAYYITL